MHWYIEKYEADYHISPRKGGETEKSCEKLWPKVSKIHKIYKSRDSVSLVKCK